MLPRGNANDGLLQLLVAFYPETKGKTLEQMDNLFKRLVSDTESVGQGNNLPEGLAKLNGQLEEEITGEEVIGS
jgi:hypothetical protein